MLENWIKFKRLRILPYESHKDPESFSIVEWQRRGSLKERYKDK